MSNITNTTVFQAIWDADQAGNGVQPILSSDTSTPRDPEKGYVIVDWPDRNDKNHKVLQAGAVIPDKDRTYEKCKALFDNYELDPSKRETETIQETGEIDGFINAIKDTPPMKIARDYLDPNQTDDEWFDSIRERWFTAFRSSSGNNYRNGFEHVIVGEAKGRTGTGGYHFWYKYYLDDGNDKVSGKDTIDFGGDKFRGSGGRKVPEVVTLNFQWDPNEERNEDNNVLNKPTGGFWVGCSPEGLMALGMARWKEGDGRTEAVINGALYTLAMYLDNSNQYINTFYPIFERITRPISSPTVPPTGPPTVPPTGPPSTVPGGEIKISAALVNPFNNGRSDERGLETVTLTNTSNATVSLSGWSIKDKNGSGFELALSLKAGESQVVTLSGAPRTAQLSNKGGSITLVDGTGSEIDSVTYSRNTREGEEVVF